MTDSEHVRIIVGFLLMQAGVLLTAAIIIRRLLSRHGAARFDSGAPVRQTIRQLMTELDALAARVDARIDGRLAELKAQSARAEAAAEKLRRAPPEGGDAVQSGGPKAAEIRRLHRQGLDSVEIARHVGLEVGEVELVLNLQRSQGGG